jgi:succinate dehydrogenase / fumarate reductase membrane anchor subunit
MVFFAALLLHAWVGLRDVVLDYIKPLALRVGVLALLGFALLAVAMWAGRILFIAFGS